MFDVALLRWTNVWTLAWALVVAPTVRAADATSPTGEKYAVVIGVSDFDDSEIAPLPFVKNDVVTMVETLAALGYSVYPFCETSVKFDSRYDKKIAKPQLPTKENIERAFTDPKNGALRTILKRKNATLLVYFSGHGTFTSQINEKTWLVLRDSKLKNRNNSGLAADTMLSAQALREMTSAAECKRRLLLLDACHAAGTRGEENAYSELFARVFREGGVDGVATFASCAFYNDRGNDVSGMLAPYVKRFDESQKKRAVSAFTYWVNEALTGFADGVVDGRADGVVGSDELFAYVERNFEWMRSCGRHWQTPAIVAAKDEKPFGLCGVLQRDYWETIDALAEQIVTKALILGKLKVDVEDFDVKFASAELRNKSGEAGALYSFAASATEQLRASVREKWKTMARGTVMRTEGIAADRLFVAKGVVAARLNAKQEVEYELRINNNEAAQKSAPLDAAAILGFKAAPENALKGFDAATGRNGLPMNARLEARGANENVWRTRPIREIGGVQWVELNPGETYRVVFEPNGAATNGEQTIMRLLVDGRNSLAQYEPSVSPPSDFSWQLEKDAANFGETTQPEEAQEKPKIVVAPVVPLDHAKYWVLEPRNSYVIDGFCDQFSQTSDVFTVARADDATVADAPPEEERGLIVVAFYETNASRDPNVDANGDAMTVPGPRKKYSTIVVKGLEPGAPLGILRLRYASAAWLARLEETNAPSIPMVGDSGD